MRKATTYTVPESMLERRAAWEIATELVIPIIEDHGLEEYKTGPAFLTHGTTMTKVDQNVENIIRVANWLLDRD